jgi:TDG/mug DNA glycosylase family protein
VRAIGAALLEDILPPGLRLVFVGEAPGDESARRGHYFAKRGNSFWEDLFECGLTSVRLTPEQDRDLPRYGIGLTDVVKDLANSQLKREARCPQKWRDRAAQLQQRIEEASPRIVCFNGLSVARHVLGRSPSPGKLTEPFAGAEAWAVDSSSGRAWRYRERRLRVLKRLARRLAETD